MGSSHLIHAGVQADGEGDGGGIDLNTLLNHPGLVLALGIFLLLIVLTAAVVTAIAYRRLRRNGVLERGLLTWKAQVLPPGPAREIADMRLRMGESLDQTRRAVALAEVDRPVGEMPRLVRELDAVANNLQGQLRLVETEPDLPTQRELLPHLRKQSEAVLAAAMRIRRALAGAADSDDEGRMPALSAQVDAEVQAVQAGVQRLRELTNGA